jgi:uncharacterized surface anchored protein
MKKTISIILSLAFVLLAAGYASNADAQTATGTLIVIKQVVNAPGGSTLPGSFLLNVNGTGVSAPIIAGNTAGTAVTLQPGAYSVTEPATTGFTSSFSTGCSGTITAGQTITCTVTNTAIGSSTLGTIIVTKHVINDNGGVGVAGNSTISVFAAGGGATPTAFAGSETGTVVTINPGAYAITETSFPAGYVMSASTGCTGTIAAGDVRTCVITNNDVLPGMPTTGFDPEKDSPNTLFYLLFGIIILGATAFALDEKSEKKSL